ncbi:hypothetical protein [Viridibacillus arvi]|uniref:hypothetical protein n=1 Tax=Viridibacillus arvi TaxID=263475 RepID=UPI003D26A1F8
MAKLKKSTMLNRFLSDFPEQQNLFKGEAAVKGDLITNRRTAKSYSQAELASAADLPIERIYLAEGGSIELDQAEYEKIFSILDISQEDIEDFRSFFKQELELEPAF